MPQPVVVASQVGIYGATRLSPLYLLRHSRRLSQAALAQRAGLARETISRLEMGRESPRWETVLKLADALGYPPTTLFPPPRRDKE